MGFIRNIRKIKLPIPARRPAKHLRPHPGTKPQPPRTPCARAQQPLWMPQAGRRRLAAAPPVANTSPLPQEAPATAPGQPPTARAAVPHGSVGTRTRRLQLGKVCAGDEVSRRRRRRNRGPAPFKEPGQSDWFSCQTRRPLTPPLVRGPFLEAQEDWFSHQRFCPRSAPPRHAPPRSGIGVWVSSDCWLPQPFGPV